MPKGSKKPKGGKVLKPRQMTGGKVTCKSIPTKAPCKSTPATGRVKKPLHYWLGTVAHQEICWYQKLTDLLIAMLPFQRLVREIAQNVGHHGNEYRFQLVAIFALQEAAVTYLLKFFDDTNLCAIHTNPTTIQLKDIFLV